MFSKVNKRWSENIIRYIFILYFNIKDFEVFETTVILHISVIKKLFESYVLVANALYIVSTQSEKPTKWMYVCCTYSILHPPEYLSVVEVI